MNLQENISRLKKLMNLTEGGIVPNPETLEMLDGVDPKLKQIFLKIQEEIGVPLRIKYGTRTSQQNQQAGGASQSSHLTGKALDIKLDSPNRDLIKKLISLASKYGILGVGVYRDAEDLHIDIDETKGRRAWGPDYTQNSIPKWSHPEITSFIK